MASHEISKIAPSQKAILDRYRSNYPVKLGELAHELGVSIKIASMPTGVSGQIRQEDGHYVIRVNRHEARERQRFTIAHELSHFLLHRSVIDSSPDGITDNVLYRSGAPERIEFEANRLAADIVMPLPLVESKMKELGGIITDSAIESLAASFQVSKAAMEIRLSMFAET